MVPSFRCHRCHSSEGEKNARRQSNDSKDASKDRRTLTVQRQSKVSAIPDIATLSVEVSRDGADMDPVLTQVRQEMNKVLEAVKAQGIAEKDVRTEFFQVHPKYEVDKKNKGPFLGRLYQDFAFSPSAPGGF